MAEAVVAYAVQQLGDLAIQEVKNLFGVREEVDQLRIELRRMQSFLKDADARVIHGDERVRNWVAEIRDLAYDAEDVIKTFTVEEVESKKRNFIGRFACVLNEGVRSHQVRSEIVKIKENISSLTRSLVSYGINNAESSSSTAAYRSQQQLTRSYSHTENEAVGLEDRTMLLVTKLVNDKCQVVSIWGMGGLGKTTLAKSVYKHVDVRNHFHRFAWQYISQHCQTREVLEGILIKLTSPSQDGREEIKKLRDEEIKKKIYEVQQENKCLIVIDDIWHTGDWDALKDAFPSSRTASKLLLTTRTKEVALYVDRAGFLYEPQCLDDEKSWVLLQRIAIRLPADKIDPKIEELGKEMAGKCGGLPLAITVLGGILAQRFTGSEWHKVHENIKSYIRRGRGDGQEQFGVMDVLALSYDDLPPHLKPCFLYLCQFPEDYEISITRLTLKWIAEGFVKLDKHGNLEEETIEDVAESYLHKLVERCMVQVEQPNPFDPSKVCRMHDLMRDLCLRKAKEENFFHVIGDGWDEVENAIKIRRLALHLNPPLDFSGRIPKNPIRSLLIVEPSSGSLHSLQHVFADFKLLSSLDLLFFRETNNYGVKLPKSIGKLIHLRFLSVRSTQGRIKLPSSIGNLKMLQTLEVNTGLYCSANIPNVIWKMKQLRHLYLPVHVRVRTRAMVHAPSKVLRLDDNWNLQSVEGFPARYCDIKALMKMKNLRVLFIHDVFSIKTSGESFKSISVILRNLRALGLGSPRSYHMNAYDFPDAVQVISDCINLSRLVICGPIKELPIHSRLSPFLIHINLSYCRLEQDPMVTLEKLPDLISLRLDKDAFVGKEMVCSSQGFPRLQSLVLRRLVQLERWRVDEGAMPNLLCASISICLHLESLPEGLGLITSLRRLELNEMPERFKDKLVQGGEDYHKVQHIPSVIFRLYGDDDSDEHYTLNRGCANSREGDESKRNLPWRICWCIW